MGKFVLLKGQSNYGSLRLHIDQLYAAFKELGFDPVIVDLLETDAIEKLNTIIQQPVDFFLGFNGMGIDLKVGEQSLYDLLNVPYIAAMVDHPHIHLKRLTTSMNQLYVAVLDEGHQEFLKNYFPANHIQSYFLWPPGGNHNLSKPIVQHTEEDFIEKRDIPVLFTGSFRGIPQRSWKDNAAAIVKILDNVADVILDHDTLNFEEGLDLVLKSKGIELSVQQKNKLYQLMPQVNNFVHSSRRYNFLDTLAKADIPLHLYGQGWESMKEKWSSFLIQEEGSFAQTLDLLPRAKIVLNTNTHFVNGAHERVFAAMINGAAVLTDVSTYYEKKLKQDESILFYKWSELKQAPKTIETYLENQSALYKIASQGQQLALENHSWKVRALEILDFIEMNINLANIREI
ncbi:glycosyltransferase [Ureibacillus chungkukjangi]|uniref:glycosyltransferase family protein n=1 Tax=Ureibacillus chungkukjangi TaxID=1202712 RepID=UPI00203F9662|nr:glycosyltransferase [Ureibacillus chungkukjangi]MCM3389783.1 glycosyltransferase [Ureibacillus chungkukjangi]